MLKMEFRLTTTTARTSIKQSQMPCSGISMFLLFACGKTIGN